MPELPEVETIRMGLEKYLLGQKIEDVDVRLGKTIKDGDVKDLIGGKIERIRRFGKALSIDLSNGYSIAIHIKLTGQLIYDGPGKPKDARPSEKLVGKSLPDRHTHIIFKLGKGGVLYYRDIRQFGWIRILKTDKVETLPFIHELGPEPPAAKAIGGQALLTPERFKEILGKKKTKIKPLLMDQKVIGGIGNIYANDALFLARIDPRRPANSLSPSEQSKLYEAILEVLKRGLKYGGATEINFVNPLGQPGGYQEHVLVYGREGERCKSCEGKIKKIRLGGRGTYLCTKCQK